MKNQPQFVSSESTTLNCERCKYYLMIDSGYGYCKRFPPKTIKEKKWFWQSRGGSIEYQIVEWNREACGEFQANLNKIWGKKKELNEKDKNNS